ncbi:MAG: pyridoxal phosphate-dependent aminotransferase [Bdellovibrionales bacterium]|nr:pyridoxal phosphate-dependent aminotransferase [Bdellovibrionales bacterium]
MIANPLIEKLQPSATLELNQKAKSMAAMGQSIINLTAGEPDFDTPLRVREAAIKAMNSGETHYTAVGGIAQLKEAIATLSTSVYSRAVAPKNIIVTSGAKQALFNLFYAILRPQDEVVVFSPYWVSYADMVAMVGGQPVIVKTDIQSSFEPSIEAIESVLNSKTRAIILNSPSNPTGAMYSQKFFEEFAKLMAKHPEILIVTDDIYRQLVYNGKKFMSIGMFEDLSIERLVLIDGVSKAYSMTGWRLGWAVASEPIIKLMAKIQGQTTSNASSISQWAALEAIQGDQKDVIDMRDAFEHRRDELDAFFSKRQLFSYHKPEGAFYFFPDCKKYLGCKTSDGLLLDTDITLCLYLLEKCGVAVVPGTAFGAPGHFRISFGSSIDQLLEGAKRLEKGLKEIQD